MINPSLQPTQLGGFVRPRKSWFLYCCFLVLCAITVCNLNAVASKIYSLPQFLSPLILLSGLAGLLAVPGPRFSKISNVTKANLFLICIMIVVGWIGLALEQKLTVIIKETYAHAASLFVLGSSAIIIARVAEMYGLKKVLMVCFVIFGIATASVFIGVASPSWNAAMSNAASGERASGFFGNPNEAGTAACLFVSIGFALSALTRNTRWFIVALAIAVPAVFFTFSRGSLIALFMISTFLSFIVFPPKEVLRILFVVICVGIAVFVTKELLENRSESVARGSSLERRLSLLTDLLSGKIDDETTGGRTMLIKEAVNEWSKSPVYGLGLGGLTHMPESNLGPHNLFLKMLGETGIIGIGCFLAGLFLIFQRGWLNRDRTTRVLMLGVFLSFMMEGLTGHGGLIHRNFMFAIGLALGVDYYTTKMAKQQPPNIQPSPQFAPSTAR